MHSLSSEKLYWIQIQRLVGPLKVFGSRCCVFLALYCRLLLLLSSLKCKLLGLNKNLNTFSVLSSCCKKPPKKNKRERKERKRKKIPTALCLTVGIVLMRWCSLLGFLHTDQRILLLMVCKLFRCLLANSQWAVICILVTNGLCLATLPWRPDRGSVAPVVVLL